MKMPYTKTGKCGNRVWQRNLYGQICSPAFIPANPRSPAQCVVRGTFGAVSARWRTLAEEQRLSWDAVARTILSRPRLGCGPLTGFNYFVKILKLQGFFGRQLSMVSSLLMRTVCPTARGI